MATLRWKDEPEEHDYPPAADYPHVRSDLDKVRKGNALSPVLLVRGDIDSGLPAHIADR